MGGGGGGGGDNERLCATEPRLRSKRFPPPAGIELGPSEPAGQRLITIESSNLQNFTTRTPHRFPRDNQLDREQQTLLNPISSHRE